MSSPKGGELEAVAIDHLFVSIQSLLKGEMEKAGIDFTVVIDNVDSVMLDASLVEQVLINLIKNRTHAVEGVENPARPRVHPRCEHQLKHTQEGAHVAAGR